MAKPDVVFAFEDHWVTIPRSILKKHDMSLGPICAANIVAMHVRVTKIVIGCPQIVSEGEVPKNRSDRSVWPQLPIILTTSDPTILNWWRERAIR
eukprot:899486-Prymnesium_polylepis.2